MKKNYLSLLLLVSSIIYGQDIQELLEQDICYCVGKQTKKSLNPSGIFSLKACLRGKIWNYSPEFKSILKEEHFIVENADNSYKYDINLTNLGRFMAGQLEFFIQECDVYYLYSSALRMKELGLMRVHYPAKMMAQLTKKIKKSKIKKGYYYERGIRYMALGEYENAKQDFYKCLEEDPQHEKAMYALGWAYELNEEFEVAMGWYQRLTKKDNNYDAAKGLEITKRKIKDKEEFEAQKLFIGHTILMNASKSKVKNKEEVLEKHSAPIMQGCEGLTGQGELKRCMSELVKRHVNLNFNIDTLVGLGYLKSGKYIIHAAFKISPEGKISDIKVLFNDPFVIHEVKRVLNSIPPILKPSMTEEGKPIGVYYSLPITFLIYE